MAAIQSLVKLLSITVIVCLLVLAIVNAEWCYQEFANVSTACGGLDTGGYFDIPSEWPEGTKMDQLYDGNWSTYSYGRWLGDPASMFVNYSKPINATSSSLWQVRYGYGGYGWTSNTTNFTIPTNCLNQEPLQFKLISNNSASKAESIYLHCYDGTIWELIKYQNASDGIPAIYEEAMWWDTPPSSDTCDCPSPAANWNIEDTCTTTGCDVSGYGININAGSLSILGDVVADYLAICDDCELINIPNDGNELIIVG